MARGDHEGTGALTPIFHITSRAAWESALGAGIYEADSLSTEGFIHCSTADQYNWVGNQRFRGRLDLVLLHIDPTRLRSEVRYENLEGGATLFPHVYGAIPIGAVLNVTPFLPGTDGTFSDPAKK
jgi:uncharacterized protein (DUF952 family)